MSIDILTTLLVATTSVLLTVITYFIYKNMKKGSYDLKNNKATLDEIRSSLEKQVYLLNERMIQNEERWKDVNHLLLSDVKTLSINDFSQNKTHFSNFLRSHGLNDNDLVVDEKFIFVLTPFNDDHYAEYKVIREACESLGYKCFRGDETNISGDIFPEMLKLITKAKFVIANINGRSPNVMYELGVAHAIDKPVILVAHRPQDLPIDIKSKRFLIYNNFSHLTELLRKEILGVPTT